MSLDEVGDELQRWNDDGELKNTFSIDIGADVCRKKNDEGVKVLPEVEHKVVHDYTGEEGTGVWSNEEAVDKHVPAPTLSTAHFLRKASGDLEQRLKPSTSSGRLVRHRTCLFPIARRFSRIYEWLSTGHVSRPTPKV